MFEWRGNNNNKCPCYQCEDRRTGCHGECERYAVWRKGMDEKKEAELNAKSANGIISETAVRKMWRKQRYMNQQPIRRSGNNDR